MSDRLKWLILYLTGFISLVLVSFIETGMLKIPTVIVLLSISPFISVNFYFMYFEALLLCAYKLLLYPLDELFLLFL